MSNLQLPSRSSAAVIIEASVCVALNITSIIGNSLVCTAAYRNLNLRSTTNLYIIALAVSDLLVATIEIPLTSLTLIVGKWDFGDALCQIQGFVAEFAFYMTPGTLGLTAFNRYVKIVKTNHYKKIFSPRRSKIWLSCLWLSLALYLFTLRVTNWIKIDFIQRFALCAFTYPSSEIQIIHYCIAVGFYFVLPLCIGIFSYYKIFLKTHEHQQNADASLQNRNENGAAQNSVKELNITRMLFYVAAGFLCCWIPMWAMVLWFRFSPETCPRTATLLTIFLFFFSTTVNPIIYTFTNGEFRKEFHRLLCC
ncbi:alpha-2Db adrenergic receptor-like [Stylophora pistillata]|uniref:alpha-2Db adrenergic receptor-like n=1 Tax=Stylophora pistillata TaxID=50429 RepID=UPI000C053692|nr:alpha-2Db adrenergic receptor-like [Stylophora pistillata]